MNDLKPCPFCGGASFFLVHEEYELEPKSEVTANKSVTYKVFCLECGCGTPYMRSKDEAIEAWNRRASNG